MDIRLKSKSNAITEFVPIHGCTFPLNPFDPIQFYYYSLKTNNEQKIKTCNIYSTTIGVEEKLSQHISIKCLIYFFILNTIQSQNQETFWLTQLYHITFSIR